jgi:hypothetical protein
MTKGLVLLDEDMLLVAEEMGDLKPIGLKVPTFDDYVTTSLTEVGCTMALSAWRFLTG